MARTQFPVVAGFALTVNKAQGLTIKDGVVIHLNGSKIDHPASKHGLLGNGGQLGSIESGAWMESGRVNSVRVGVLLPTPANSPHRAATVRVWRRAQHNTWRA